MLTHTFALVHQENKISVSEAVSLCEFLETHIADLIFRKYLSYLLAAFKPYTRIVLLSRVYAIHKARLGLIKAALRYEDKPTVKVKLLHQDIYGDGEGSFAQISLIILALVQF